MTKQRDAFSNQVAASGLAMATRQAIGTLLSITGTLVVTRLIGPGTYGMFAATTAIQSYVGSLANAGVEVSLLRTHSTDADSRDRQGLVLVLGLSSLGALVCLAFLPALARWIDAPSIMAPGRLVFASLPLAVSWIVPRARLSREMAFQRIAIIELTAQAGGVSVALILAIMGAGLWAPTIGWFVQNLILTTLFFIAARPRPAIVWDPAALRGLVRDAWSFSASSLVWQSKGLINPLVVGHFLGTEGVGHAALCARVVEVLSFVRTGTWHMLIASFARVRADNDRLRSYVVKAAELQALALAPMLIVFALLGPAVFPAIMGDKWRPVLVLFPYFAVGALATSIATPLVAALYACGTDLLVLRIRLAQVLCVFLATSILVPGLGLTGVGYGELTVVFTAVLFVPLSNRVIGQVQLSVATLWFCSAAAVIFWTRLGPLAFFAPIATILVPQSRAALREHAGRAMLGLKGFGFGTH